jgi:hypothetical protein
MYNRAMLKAALEPEALQLLFKRSHFKEAQLDALLVKRSCDKNGVKLKEGLRMRDKEASLGSTLRSASQAEGVISKSIASLVLAISMGLVSSSTLEAASKVASAVEQSMLHRLDEEQFIQLTRIVDAFLQQASHQ